MPVAGHKRDEGLFTILAKSSPIGIYIVQGRKLCFVNQQFQRQTGYGEEELMGMDPLELVTPEDRGMVRENAIKMLRGEETSPYEYRVVYRDGTTRWIMETVTSIQYDGQRAALGNFMDVTERKQQEHLLAHLATHDPLTGLSNRRSLGDALERSVARARRGNSSALLFLDVDNFKNVNDRLGHAAGDRALVSLARLLQDQVRAVDLPARMGGDEFAVLLDGTNLEGARAAAERIRLGVEALQVTLDDLGFRLSLSIGLVAVDGRIDPGLALSRADSAMYRAKEQGGNRIVLYGGEEEPRPTRGQR
ncbi:MAG: sensor domain-containing diguanylate cyclase [Chloroflexi bacterium]|nr:sensor domain-containing diguanylate cyclase [Chloroflexota bacterium]